MDRPIKCNHTLLKIDEACLQLRYLPLDLISDDISVYTQSSECDECPVFPITSLKESQFKEIVLTTKYSTILQLESSSLKPICRIDYSFEEFGIYSLNFTHETCTDISTVADPANIYLSLLIVFTTSFALYLLIICLYSAYHHNFFSRYCLRRQNETHFLVNDLGSPSGPSHSMPVYRSPPTDQFKRERLKCLDAFRGICISLMIFVNYGGGGYQIFSHSVWNGLTVADLVFPWFMWIMGVSFVLSIRSQLRKVLSRKLIIWKIIKRSLTLFALGIMVNSTKTPKLENLRIPGVLQRFSVTYFLTASLEAVFSKPGDPYAARRWGKFREVVYGWHQLALFLICCILSLGLTFLLPVPNCPSGYLGPGGWHNNLSYYNCTGGAAGYIDRKIFGQPHLRAGSLSQKMYQSPVSNDPEGMVGTVLSVLTVTLGTYIGRTLTVYKSSRTRLLRWFTVCLVTGCGAVALSYGKKNGGPIPINKNLWSFSFVLATNSLAIFLFALLYLLIDLCNKWDGTPFIWPGMNSIALYIGHEFTKNIFPWGWHSTVSSHFSYLCINVWGTLLWILISAQMYHKNLFITL